MRPTRRALSLLLCFSLTSCLIVKRKTTTEVPPNPQRVSAAFRIFMADGSLVVFPDGAEVGSSMVTGSGQRYDLTRAWVGPEDRVPLDSVLGMESFDSYTDPGLTMLASIGVTAITVAGTVALICATDPKCFGSCPTVYSYDDEGERLEAEAFSFSISPLLESRDVDVLSVQPDDDGMIDLEVRNEALETHFINNLELIEARHPSDEQVVTDPGNLPLRVGPLQNVEAVTDRDGRDVTGALAQWDSTAFASSASRISSATADDDRDWLEFTLPALDVDSAAVVLKLRNSLLTTILFYEFVLGQQGAQALDWMAHDIQRIGTAVELGSWFYRTTGLRLEVERDGRFEEIARLGDTGPIAWKKVAFLVPVERRRPTRVRLSFLADEWRIDGISWSPRAARPVVRTISASSMTPLVGGGSATDHLDLLTQPDDDYLVTSAGTAFSVRFAVGGEPEGMTRTFLLGSQGYYSEWIRPNWVRSARSPRPFEPTDALVPALMGRWLEVRGPMEKAFHETKIPVR